MMRRLSALLFAALLAAAMCVCPAARAQTPAAPSVDPNRSGTSGASLSGVVVDQNQNPIFHARISIETGQWTSTAEDGTFRLDGIAAGQHTVTIKARAHHTGGKTVTFTPNQQMTMMVMLTADNPVTTKPVDKRGTFYIQAYQYSYGNKRYYVKHCLVTQYDDPMKDWEKYLWNGNDGPGFYMPCEDAILGKHYNVTITWRSMDNPDGTNDDSELTGTWYKRFDTDWDTWTFYNPY